MIASPTVWSRFSNPVRRKRVLLVVTHDSHEHDDVQWPKGGGEGLAVHAFKTDAAAGAYMIAYAKRWLDFVPSRLLGRHCRRVLTGRPMQGYVFVQRNASAAADVAGCINDGLEREVFVVIEKEVR